MIIHYDDLLYRFFIARIDEITDEEQAHVQLPDEDRRTCVSDLTADGQSANVVICLVDLEERRKLRLLEKVRRIENCNASLCVGCRNVSSQVLNRCLFSSTTCCGKS